jgi:MFS transporter, OFA family, oxalate/formate antiporter
MTVAVTTSVEKERLLVKRTDKFDSLTDPADLQSVPILSSSTFRGTLCVLGGTLAHFTFGSVYCWGNFNSYAPHYLKSDFIFPLTIVAQCFTMPFGPLITRKYGARKSALIGSWIMSFGVYFSSFATDLHTFTFCYSIMVGCGIGIAYTAPMVAGWSWLPNSKGFVSGAVLTGFGLGGFFFNLVGSNMVNPLGIDPVRGRFPDEIHDSFPLMLRNLASIYSAISLVGCILITEPPKVVISLDEETDYENDKDKDKRDLSTELLGVTIAEAIKTPQFWLMWAMIITSASAGLNVASMYKQFAAISPQLKGDSYQALTGGMGALFNGFGRLFWGSVSDKIGFKLSFTILTVSQALLQMVYPYSQSSKVRYTLFLFLF